jgi:hypothetical protein
MPTVGASAVKVLLITTFTRSKLADADHLGDHHVRRMEIGLPGWACKIRTDESVGELSDWICMTIRPEVGAIRVAETLRVPAA